MKRKILDLAQEQRKAGLRRMLQSRSVYPLTAPGIAPPGPNFLRYAADLIGVPLDVVGKDKDRKLGQASEALNALYRKATFDPQFQIPIWLSDTRKVQVQFIPGHLGRKGAPYGPRPARVMVIGKNPGREEVAAGRNFVGPSSKLFVDKLGELGIQGYEEWYLTNLVKFLPPPDAPFGDFVKDCRPILDQELRLVRPDLILCLGSDASKALLGGDYSVSAMAGRVVEHTFPVYLDEAEPEYWKSLVMTVPHPASVLRDTGNERELELGLMRWARLLSGVRFDLEREDDVDHRVIDNRDDLLALLYEAHQTCTDKLVAVDAEWHGQHPGEPGSYLRTVQFSWAEKKAACIVIRRKGGAEVEPDWDDFVRSHLREFFADKRVIGHFFNADLEWLVWYGLDLRPQFAVPLEPKNGLMAWERTRTEGGCDTGLLFHAIEETARFGLEHLSMRYTTAPRYDLKLEEWKKSWCKENGVELKHLEGYGDAPDSVLYEYANYDADVARRLFFVGEPMLDYDRQGNCCREAYWRHMAAAPAALEIRLTGITLDRPRLDEMTQIFIEARDQLEQQVREDFRWPDFNLRSHYQVREALFGEQLNGAKLKPGEKVRRLRPPEATTLRLTPILSTGKRPMPWDEVQRRGLEGSTLPSTNKTVLGILQHEARGRAAEVVGRLRDYRFLDQVLKSVLAPPEWDEESGNYLLDEDEEFVYDGGLAKAVCHDGRVRTFISQTKETGRWASSRPNLMAISKSRDKDYSRILGDRYKYKLRSLLRAGKRGEPGHWCDEDCVLVEADFKGAELAVMAWLSGDPVMCEHVARANLDENDPDYYDIHSNIAVAAFRLNCAPTKKALEEAGYGHLRNAAKAIIFGSAYGRGPKAIVMAAREEGVAVTLEEVAVLQGTIFKTYSKLEPFFEKCRERVLQPGWICNPFGSFRRFPKNLYDESMLHDLQREAQNWPIQSTVAEAVSDAVRHLMAYRRDSGDPDMFRIVLQIHDALLFEVPLSRVAKVVNEVIPLCMERKVPVFPCDLDGMPVSNRPHYFGTEIEVFVNWGEKLPKSRLEELGVAA